MNNFELTNAVEQFASMTCRISDPLLERPWAWKSYDSEGVRFAFLRTYEELRELAANLQRERMLRATPPSTAQLILAQYDAAYWDLQAALLGIEDGQAERAPAEGEWPVRRVLAHVIAGDLGFFVVVRNALDRQRSGAGPAEVTQETWAATSGMDEAAFESVMSQPVKGLRSYHAGLHMRILKELADISDVELEGASSYWEAEPMSIRFRLHRFDSHLRQHTVQIDKARQALGQVPSEAQRLLRLIYAALAETNGALIGAGETGADSRLELAKSLHARAGELTAICA